MHRRGCVCRLGSFDFLDNRETSPTRILLAVDGSPVAARAARFVVRLGSRMEETPQVVLFNADEPLLKSVAIHLGVQGVAKYHAENGKFALKTAKGVLDRADVIYPEQPKPDELPGKAATRHRKKCPAWP